MKPRFEIGDKVIEKEPCFGGYGYVMSINHYNDPDYYVVKFANGDERVSYIEDFYVEDSEIKMAFLTRLQELLATFDAKISGGGDGYGNYMACCIGNGKSFSLGEEDEFGIMSTVTAQNIFNHDKD